MLTGVVVLTVAVVVVGAIALHRRRTDGRFAPGTNHHETVGERLMSESFLVDSDGGSGQNAPDRLTEHDLGVPLGSGATLVQFSSSFCAPCRAARVLLADVAERSTDVRHVELDAESRLDLVRRLGILRTPTVLVLNSQGEITDRASGVPTRRGVLTVLARAGASSIKTSC